MQRGKILAVCAGMVVVLGALVMHSSARQPPAAADTSFPGVGASVQCPPADPKSAISPCEAISSDRRYIAVLTFGEAGAGILKVRATNGSWSAHAPSKDVNGIVWSAHAPTLFFTVSPIYGKPGIYMWSLPSKRPKRIFGPSTRTKDYPDGADFFELVGISESGARLLFLYDADVDRIDFHQFRNLDHLYSIGTDGSGFRKAKNKE